MMYLNAVLGLIFVIGLIMLLGWAMKKAGFQFDNVKSLKNAKENIKIIETIRLDHKRKLWLLSCHKQNFLIMTGDKDLLISNNIELNLDFGNDAEEKNSNEKALL